MDDVRQEMPNKGPILKLDKRLKQEIWHTRQGMYDLSGLEKRNSIAFLEVKLLAEKPCKG